MIFCHKSFCNLIKRCQNQRRYYPTFPNANFLSLLQFFREKRNSSIKQFLIMIAPLVKSYQIGQTSPYHKHCKIESSNCHNCQIFKIILLLPSVSANLLLENIKQITFPMNVWISNLYYLLIVLLHRYVTII